jgi:hypothetical protein
LPEPAKAVLDSIEAVIQLAPVPLSVDWRNIRRPALPGSFPIEFEIPPQAGGNEVIIPCQLGPLPLNSHVWLRVRAEVSEGEVIFGIRSGADDTIRNEVSEQASDGARSVMLETDGLTSMAQLIIRNVSSNQTARIVVEGFDAGTLQ